MPNMSYCKFTNTEIDLNDCLNILEDEAYEVSVDEIRAAERMLEKMAGFLEDIGAAELIDYDYIKKYVRESLHRESREEYRNREKSEEEE